MALNGTTGSDKRRRWASSSTYVKETSLSLRKDTDPLRAKLNTQSHLSTKHKNSVLRAESVQRVRGLSVAIDKSIEKRYEEWERENDSAQPVS
jgi:hypothetical protein